MEEKDTFKFKLVYHYEEIARSLNIDSSILLGCLREKDIISQEEEEWIWEEEVRKEEEEIRKGLWTDLVFKWCCEVTLMQMELLQMKKEHLQRDRQSLV